MMDKNIYKEVPEVVHSAVLNALDSLEEYDGQNKNAVRKRFYLSRVAAACIVCFLVSGITVSAMKAISLYRQRMEDMNEKMLEEYYTIACTRETNEYNRPFTEEEKVRYHELSEEYENNGLFPESQITCLQSADEYDGKGIAVDITSCTIYLPDGELSDEELLELVDLNHKIAYSIYEINKERVANASAWESRMSAMDDEEVDKVYIAMCTTERHVSGGYSRSLTEEESSRYDELNRCYEEEGLFPVSEPSIIQTAKEYTGEGIAVCVAKGMYYIPDQELTDEEILQIIDFEHKVRYSLVRIGNEIDMGFRKGYPRPQ